MPYSDNMEISLITYADYIDMVAIYRDFYQESKGKDVINFNVDKLISFFDAMIEDESMNVALKCTFKGKIVGFRTGSISTMDFSTTPMGFERGSYVNKESRGTRAAMLLLTAWYDWLDLRNIKPAIEMVFFSDDNELTYKFCDKKMREIGRIYERVT